MSNPPTEPPGEPNSNTGTRTGSIEAALRACEAFVDLGEAEMARVCSAAKEVSLPADVRFLQAGEKGTFLDVLAEGRVAVFLDAEEGDEDLQLAVLQPGELMGEMEFFDDSLRSASGRTLEECRVVRIDYDELRLLLDDIPSLSASFLKVVSKRLRVMNARHQSNWRERRLAERSLKHLSDFLNLADEQTLGKGIEGLIKRIVHLASKVMKADRASLFLIDPLTGNLWSKVAEGAASKTITVPRGKGIAGWVAEHGEILNIPEAYEDDRFNRAVDTATGYRTRTILCGPVKNLEGSVIGVIQVINKLGGTFDDRDIGLFNAFAHQAAIAVDNYQLYQSLASSHRKMAIMLDVANTVAQTLEIADLIKSIIEKTIEVLGCDRSTFFIYDRKTDELWSIIEVGTERKEIRFPASVGLAGHAATRDEVLNIEDVYEDERFNQAIDKQTGYRTRSVLCVPVHNLEGEVIGVSQAINKLGGSFTDEDVDLFRAIAAQIGVAQQNAQLYAETASMKNHLHSVQESITDGIITLDPAGGLVTANSAASRLLSEEAAAGAAVATGEGEAEEPLIGRPLASLFPTPDHPLARLLEEVNRTREPVVEQDTEVTMPRGHNHSMNLKALPLTDSDGEHIGAVIVLEDITKEKRLKNNLTRYLAKDIVDKMLADPEMEGLGGNRIKATVLFSDIREFTTIAEGLTAEQTMDFLNEFFSMMVDEIIQEEGLLDKFIGDAMMAVFGIPYNQEDDAVRAVRAGVNMIAALKAYNARRTGEGLAEVKMGIGINTDEVISGNMGSEKKMDYTVIGDGVNVSSRIEGLNKAYGTHLLISDRTRAEIGDHFTTRVVDFVRVKGKTEPIKLYEVLGEGTIELTPAQSAFREGFSAYQEQRFEDAARCFESVAEEDYLSRTFLGRAQHFIQNPPSGDWDGVFTATFK